MKSLTLCLSAGRSGTEKLSQILSLVPGMTAEHEGDPGFHTVRLDNARNQMIGHDFVASKLNDWKDKEHVAHTGHMIWEGFVEHLFAEGITPNVILLRRPYREIALSMFRLGWIPGRNELIRPWYNGPDEPDALHYEGWEKAHPYQLCYWWCLETERRIRYYLPLLKELDARVYTITTKQMLNDTQFDLMLKHFDLPPLINEIPKHKVNQLEIYNSRLPVEIPPESFLEGLEADVHDNIPENFIPVRQTIMDLGVDDAIALTGEIVRNTGEALAYKTMHSHTTNYFVKPRSLEL